MDSTVKRRLRAIRTSTLTGALVAIGLLGAAAASPADDGEVTRQIIRGKLVGVSAVNDRNERGVVRLALQFLVLEEFAHAFGGEGHALIAATLPEPIELSTLTEASYPSMLAERIPDQVPLGGVCLIEMEWKGVDRGVVALERDGDEARRGFLTRHGSYVLEVQRKVIEGFPLQARRLVESALESAARQRTAAAATSDTAAATQARLGATNGLAMSRKTLITAQTRLERAAEILSRLRDALQDSDESVGVSAKAIDAVLAEVPTGREAAREFERQLTEAIAIDPVERIVPSAEPAAESRPRVR